MGVTLRGIDFRPATGELYGVGSDSIVYHVSPVTGRTVAEGPAFAPMLNGRFFGVDLNPTVDRIRVTSDAKQNLRLVPDTGALAGADADLNPNDPTSWARPTRTRRSAPRRLPRRFCTRSMPSTTRSTRRTRRTTARSRCRSSWASMCAVTRASTSPAATTSATSPRLGPSPPFQTDGSSQQPVDPHADVALGDVAATDDEPE